MLHKVNDNTVEDLTQTTFVQWATTETLREVKDLGMTIHKDQLRGLIVDVLKEVDLYSEDAVELLMLTAAVESDLGSAIEQYGNGPALGIFQMEIDTCRDIENNWLRFKDDHFQWRVKTFDNHGDLAINLKGNIPFQIVRARLHYLRKPDPLPNHRDVEAMARYWKKHYNTVYGKGTVTKAIESYGEYVS